jgi:hypothetical protein
MIISYECDVAHNDVLFWRLFGETIKRIVPAALLHDSKSRPPEYERVLYSMILSVLDPRKYEYLKDYSLDFEHSYMTTIY